MNSDPDHLDDLPTAYWNELQRIVEQFERVWNTGQPPILDEFLVGAEVERRALLLELIHLDLAYRARFGQPRPMQWYLERYPELLEDPQTLLHLLVQDFLAQQKTEPGLSVVDYARKLPPLDPQFVQGLTAAIEAHRSPEQGTQSSKVSPAALSSKGQGVPDGARSSDATNRSLLFGLLALQNNLIDRRQLVRAFDDWVADKSQSLGDLLVREGAMTGDEQLLVDALVDRHLSRHDNDPEKSLAALSSIGSAQEELSRIADDQLQASLSLVSAVRQGEPQTDADSTLALGTKEVGARFRILRPHAQGGLGAVYVAQDHELNRQVALKEIQFRYADDPSARSRFVLEAEITGGLEHPGIVPVYGLGTYADGRPFYAMRFIKGDSLQEAVTRFHRSAGTEMPQAEPAKRDSQPEVAAGDERAAHATFRVPKLAFESLAFRKLLGRFVDVCNAIEYAHSRGVLHRDLKPGNIMLGKYGETLVVDWGLAKAKGRAADHAYIDEATLRPGAASGSAPTQMGAAIGTPAYMSPEQAAGQVDQLGPASDVYSLGATLYHVLVGKPPFSKDDVDNTLRKVKSGMFLPPRQVNPGVPRSLEAICLKAMALKMADRYGSPQELADEVEKWLADEPVAAHREPLGVRTRRWLRKHPRTVAALTGTLLAGLASSIMIVAVVSGKKAELAQKNAELAQSQRELIAANRAEREATQVATQKRSEAELASQQAELARQHEAQQRQAAEAAEQRARAATEFFASVFDSTDPLGLRGMGLRKVDRPEGPLTPREMLDRAVVRADEETANQPLLQATLLNALGLAYLGQSEIEQSQLLINRAWELRRSRLDVGHPDMLASKLSQALLKFVRGEMPDAEALLREVLEMQLAAGQVPPLSIAQTQFYLGMVLKPLERSAEAETMLRAALKTRLEELGPKQPDTILARILLIDALLKQNKQSAAILETAQLASSVDTALAQTMAGAVLRYNQMEKHRVRREYDAALRIGDGRLWMPTAYWVTTIY
jgi:serine/threonine protein kinase